MDDNGKPKYGQVGGSWLMGLPTHDFARCLLAHKHFNMAWWMAL